MRTLTLVTAALAFTLAGCNGGGGGGADEETPKASKPAKADEEEGASEEEVSEAESKPKPSSSGTGNGKWGIDTHECSAMMESGDTAIKIQQTDSDLKVSFAPDWASDVDGNGKLTVGGESKSYETTTEQGHDWIVVTTPNDEFGGIHDIIANAQSIKISYSGGGAEQNHSFSLKGTNGVMDKLRKCAGL